MGCSRQMLRRIVVAVALLAVVGMVRPAGAQTTKVVEVEEQGAFAGPQVKETIDKFCRSRNIPSMAVAVFDRSGVLFRHMCGEAESTSVYYLGSLTKSMTATVAVRLAQRGELDLEAPANQYLDFELPDDIRVVDLLRHRSGIPRDAGFAGWSGGSADLATYVEGLDLEAGGGEFAYSNLNYHLVGRVIEEVSGKSYAQALEAELGDPLGMEKLGAPSSAGEVAGLMPGHQYVFGFPVERTEVGYHRYEIPAGLAVASLEDMVRFGQFHLGDGEAGEGRVLDEERLEAMHRPADGETGYAMGLGVERRFGTRVLAHNGLTRAYHSSLMLLPERDVGVVVLSNVNSYESGAAETLAANLASVAIGEPGESMTNLEFWVRLALGLVLLAVLGATVSRIAEWASTGFHVGLAPGAWWRLAVPVVVGGAVVVGVRLYIGVPLPAMWKTQPDLTGLLAGGPVLWVVSTVVGEWIRGAELVENEET